MGQYNGSQKKRVPREGFFLFFFSFFFLHFPKYHTKILLGNFNAKVRREKIFKPTTGNESLRQDINDSGVRIVNLATSKI
jgi:hypothetical protein